MKFDMNAAWRDTVALLQGNKDLLLVIAGLFFFLPALAFVLFLPDLTRSLDGLDNDAMLNAILDVYQRNAHWFVLSTILQSIGVLAMLALLRAKERPTVGEALSTGATAFVPYLIAQILLGIGIGIAIGAPVALAAASGIGALAFLIGMLAIPVMLYLMIKFAMVAPVMAIERTYNPITAMKRSWSLTKGNSLRIFLFFLLVVVAVMVIAILLTLVAQLIGAIAGTIVEGVLTSLFGAIYTTVVVGVLAAIYRQLVGQSETDIGDTFD